MALGSITYTPVTWTAGDVITEAKLDAMVANDQAYDSHADQGLVINAGKEIQTDTINERTTDAGVTIDGLLIKDSQIQTAGAVIANTLANGAFVIKKATLTSHFYTTSDSAVDITGLSVSITPPSDGIIVAFFTADCTNDTAGGYAAIDISIGGVDMGVGVNYRVPSADYRSTITTFATKAVSSGVATTVQARGRRAIAGTAQFIQACCHLLAIFIPKASSS